MTKMHWTTENIPSQKGRVVVITGANSGLGYHSSLALASKGAQVIMACRNLEKGEKARREILATVPDAKLRLMKLDLADLSSIHAFADALLADEEKLDVLLNNAGVMNIPHYQTCDGFEMQFGTNHLGHFALTGLLYQRLLATPGSRVVSLSSTAHSMARQGLNFDDLMGEKHYNSWITYGKSKLANLLFAFELERKFKQAGSSSLSVAAHPGFADTNLINARSKARSNSWLAPFIQVSLRISSLISQPAAQGALPQLYAATAPEVEGGAYYGPDGWMELRGYPHQVTPSPRAEDEAAAQRLWSVSQELTGIVY